MRAELLFMSKTELAVNKLNSVVGSFLDLVHFFGLGRTESTTLQGNTALLRSAPKVKCLARS